MTTIEPKGDRVEMKTIRKYELNDERTVIDMPIGAKILAMQMQYGSPYMWMLVSPGKKTVKRAFRVYPDEVALDEDEIQAYVGTFLAVGGHYVFHVFEEKI